MSVAPILLRITEGSTIIRQSLEKYAGQLDFEEGHPYTEASVLASCLIENRRDLTGEVTNVFRNIDRELASAGSASRSVLIVGLLEDIQNISLNREIPLDDWDAFVSSRPRVAQAWTAIKRLWNRELDPESFNFFVATGELGP